MSIAAVQPLTLNAGNSMTLMDGCTVNMHALWVRDKRGVNALTADSGVHDPYLFDACRDKSTVGWYSGPLKLGELGHEPRLPAPNSTRPAAMTRRTTSSSPTRLLARFLAWRACRSPPLRVPADHGGPPPGPLLSTRKELTSEQTILAPNLRNGGHHSNGVRVPDCGGGRPSIGGSFAGRRPRDPVHYVAPHEPEAGGRSGIDVRDRRSVCCG